MHALQVYYYENHTDLSTLSFGLFSWSHSQVLISLCESSVTHGIQSHSLKLKSENILIIIITIGSNNLKTKWNTIYILYNLDCA